MALFTKIAVILLLANVSLATEAEEARRLAPKYRAKEEVRLRDGSRVDLINKTHSIEIDFARRWAEGIGQALHYSIITGKRPGLLLLIEDEKKDWRNVVRAARVCGKYDITLYIEYAKNSR